MQKMITIIGPTASGKTSLAVAVASSLNGEIISADSRQVYRRMNIGTGKDLDEYQADGKKIDYHLIDICEPGTKYNLFEYQRDFLAAYKQIIERNKLPVLCGGTGLYVESVLGSYQLSPVPQNPTLRKKLEGKTLEELTGMLEKLKQKNHSTMHNKTDVDSPQRAIRAIEIEAYNRHNPISERMFPQLESLLVGVHVDRETRRKRISERLKFRLENGMIDEVKGLLQEGIPAENLLYYGLEYKYVTDHVIGNISYKDMYERLEIAIHQFAKRQMTWFRGMERRGFHIHWIEGILPMDEKLKEIKRLKDN